MLVYRLPEGEGVPPKHIGVNKKTCYIRSVLDVHILVL